MPVLLAMSPHILYVRLVDESWCHQRIRVHPAPRSNNKAASLRVLLTCRMVPVHPNVSSPVNRSPLVIPVKDNSVHQRRHLDWAKMPRSVSTNRTLRCVKLLCCTGISMFVQEYADLDVSMSESTPSMCESNPRDHESTPSDH
jgi:hypothetical protein